MSHKSAGRDGTEQRGGRHNLKGCGGAAVLAAIGLYLGYLFIVVGHSGVSIVAGAILVAFTAYLAWDFFWRSKRPRK